MTFSLQNYSVYNELGKTYALSSKGKRSECIKHKTYINTEFDSDRRIEYWAQLNLWRNILWSEGGRWIKILTSTPWDVTVLHMAESQNWQLHVPGLQLSAGNGHQPHFQQETGTVRKARFLFCISSTGYAFCNFFILFKQTFQSDIQTHV